MALAMRGRKRSTTRHWVRTGCLCAARLRAFLQARPAGRMRPASTWPRSATWKPTIVPASAGTRFLGVYAPQLSHEPWVDVSAGGDERNMARRRYNLMKVEDGELGELMASVERSGRLDSVLI